MRGSAFNKNCRLFAEIDPIIHRIIPDTYSDLWEFMEFIKFRVVYRNGVRVNGLKNVTESESPKMASNGS